MSMQVMTPISQDSRLVKEGREVRTLRPHLSSSSTGPSGILEMVIPPRLAVKTLQSHIADLMRQPKFPITTDPGVVYLAPTQPRTKLSYVGTVSCKMKTMRTES